jgi:hypothetical protein
MFKRLTGRKPTYDRQTSAETVLDQPSRKSHVTPLKSSALTPVSELRPLSPPVGVTSAKFTGVLLDCSPDSCFLHIVLM